MGFFINDLMKLDIMRGAEFVSGREGLNNEIVWINMMEILDQLDNIQPGELLLTTGYKLDDEAINSNLIYKLHKKGLSGIAIQPGYYIDKIPENIIMDGNLYGFPVIRLPEKLTFSHVTRTIFYKIHNSNSLINNTENGDVNQLLINMIKNKTLDNDGKDYLKRTLNTENSEGYCCMILSIQHRENGFIDKHCLENAVLKISSYLNTVCHGVLHQELITEAIFLNSFLPNSDINDISRELNNVVNNIYSECKNAFIRLSVGSVFKDLSKFSEAYNEASVNLEIMNNAGIKKGLCYKNNLYMMQLLSTGESKNNLIRFYRSALKPIMDFDNLHNTNYLHTLKAFLENNCNINKASENLFIHRHTLRYRLEKIKGICSIDFSDYNNLFMYQLAYFIHELYN